MRREVGAQCLSWGWGSKLSSGVVGVQGVRHGITRSGQATWARLAEGGSRTMSWPVGCLSAPPALPLRPGAKRNLCCYYQRRLDRRWASAAPFLSLCFLWSFPWLHKVSLCTSEPEGPEDTFPQVTEASETLWAFSSVPCSLGLFK